MKTFVVPIVEGHTEQGEALKALLNKVWSTVLGQWQPLSVQEAVRGSRASLASPTTSNELAKRIRQANNDLAERLDDEPGSQGIVLLLLDSDDDCPAKLGPMLLQAAREQCPDISGFSCVLANKEFENWLVAGAVGFVGKPDLKLPDPLEPLPDPEGRKGSAWLSEQRKKVNRAYSYKKTVDALPLVRAMDLTAARVSSPSFDKLCRELQKLVPPPEPEAPNTPPE